MTIIIGLQCVKRSMDGLIPYVGKYWRSKILANRLT